MGESRNIGLKFWLFRKVDCVLFSFSLFSSKEKKEEGFWFYFLQSLYRRKLVPFLLIFSQNFLVL